MEEKEAFKYVYFIYSLEKNKGREIISDLKNFQPKIIYTTNKKDEKNVNYNVNLYKITIDKTKLNQNETTIKIRFIDKNFNKNAHEYLIDINDTHKYIYLYDIEFRRNQNNFIFLFALPLLPQYNLTIDEKYEIFRKESEVLDDDKEVDERNLDDLIYYTQKQLEKEKQINFSFFVTVLNDANKRKKNYFEKWEKYIDLFNINKIIFDEKKVPFNGIRRIRILLHDLIDKNEDKINHDLLCILILFYKSNPNYIEKIFFDEYLNNRLYKILLEDKKKPDKEKLFLNLKLSKNILYDFLLFAKSYNDIILIMSYNNDFLESLILINKNFEFTTKKLKEQKEKVGRIKFDDFIEPKKNDDLKKIKEQIEILIISEKKSSIYLTELSSKFFEKYFILFEEDVDKLVYLFQILKIISTNKGDYKYSLVTKKVFNKLTSYLQEKKLKNMNLLIFLETTPINKRTFDIEILNNIDMNTIDEEFIKKFKEFDWNKLLNIKIEKLVIKISLLIEDIKNFGKIFLLFDFNEDIDKVQMNLIKDRFIDLLETYDEKDCNNIIDDCSKLIYFLNIKNCDLKSFFQDYFYNFFYNIADKIFCNIFSKYEYTSLNDDLKKIIYDFYKNPNNEELNISNYLTYEIQNNENFNPDDLIGYYFNYDDFFDLKQKNLFDLLEGIITKNLLDKKCLMKYKNNNKTEAKEIITKIKNGTVEYKKIKKFFKNDNDKKEFKRRIEIVSKFLGEFDKNKNLFNEIEKKLEEINKIIKDLNIIEQKMNKYFKKPKKEDIKEIQDLIIEIESYNLDYYLMNQEQIQKFLEQKDFQLLPLNFEKSNFFFKIIYDETKRKTEDEIEIVNQTKKKLVNLSNILNLNLFTNEHINTINKIMNELSEEQYKNLNEEVENLMELNNNNNDKIVSEKDKEKKINILKYIWKKDLIYNFSIIFQSILTKLKYKKTEFTSVNNLILKYLKAPKNINIIKVCLEFYKNYEIELNEDVNFEFYKSIKLITNMNEIIDYLLNIDEEIVQIKLKELDDTQNDDYFYIKNILEKLIKFKIFIEIFSSNNNKKYIKDIDIIRTFFGELNNSEEIRNNFVSIIYNYNIIKDEMQIFN